MSPPDAPPAAGWIPSHWTTLRTPSATGARNMAVDLALLDAAARDGRASWRCYGWSTPTVSFGRNERTIGRFTPEAMAAAGFDVVRRPTGGRALLHAREVTYAAAFPLPASVPWRAAYAFVNRVLLAGLHALGVPASLAARTASASGPRPGDALCFAHPDDGELVVDGAKLVGSAVWRERGGYLQHGSILLHDDQGALAALLPAAAGTASEAGDSARAATASLSAVLGAPPSAARVAEALQRALAAQLAAEVAGSSVTGAGDEASWLITTDAWQRRMSDPAWIWRR